MWDVRSMGIKTCNKCASYVSYSIIAYGTTSKEKAQTNTNDSTIKEYIDEWYESHIKDTEYAQYITDTLFCNDRIFYYTIPSEYTNLGYGTEQTAYRWYAFLISKGVTLNCVQQNDRFTVNDESMGNGDLTYPIALFTTDEAYLAGGSNTNNSKYYLYTGNIYYPMSPRHFEDVAIVNTVHSDDNLGPSSSVNISRGIRPVINL